MSKDDHGGGYGKPPKHGQFKPGQSGNPKGRKRKSPSNLGEMVLSQCNQRRRVMLDGKTVWRTQGEIMVIQQAKKAMKGDLKALQWLSSMAGDALWEQIMAYQGDREIEVKLVLEEKPPSWYCAVCGQALHDKIEAIRKADEERHRLASGGNS